MALPSSNVPVYEAALDDRAAFLKRVTLYTFGGLTVSALASLVSVAAILLAPELFLNRIVTLGVFFGGWGVVNFVARPMVFSGASSRWLGFLLGTGTQGLMMGFLLFFAAVLSAEVLGSPFLLMGLAAGITFFTGLGLAAFTYIRPRDFSMVGAALSAAAIPGVLVMGAMAIFPDLFGGPLGLVVSGLFIALTVGSLLHSLNRILHQFDVSMDVEGGYELAIGLLVLFWNVLSLLMRLTRR